VTRARRAPLYLSDKATKELYGDVSLDALAAGVYVCGEPADRVFVARSLETGEVGVIVTRAIPKKKTG
jgi:hypothetical protein